METGFETEGVAVDSVMGQGFPAYATAVREWVKKHEGAVILVFQTGQENTGSNQTRFSALIIFRPKQ